MLDFFIGGTFGLIAAIAVTAAAKAGLEPGGCALILAGIFIVGLIV
ncbi:hypothetical protein [Methylobacterium indicum]|uniref:Uncharacterized protein n=1 Tax=Methylobacterium indicum TaxID=1775910 RepID=A0A8H9CA00_9HYPH|nr:hypothetical protein [Methylobacterium indicum]BCM87783.1 hypothetical protein mvi_62440 [Methylobacterium indicum]